MSALSRYCSVNHNVLLKSSPLALCVTALLLLGAAPLAAQPDIPVSRLLFEPVLIPDTGLDSDAVNFSTPGNMPQLAARDELGNNTNKTVTRQKIEADIAGYVEAIGDIEATEGPYTTQLVQDLFATALLYQQLGDHQEAVKFFERAQNISRINSGLDTVDQDPIIQAKTQSLLALDRLRDADASQESLLEIYRNTYGEGSEELIPALETLGDWNMQAFLDRSNIALISSRMDVQNFMMQAAQSGGTPADLLFNQNVETTSEPIYKLYLAQNYYFDAINILLNNKNYTHPDLIDLERKLNTTSFLRTHQENIVYEPDFYLVRKTKATGTRLDTSTQDLLNSEDYDVGLQSIQRSQAYLSVNPERTHAQVARSMLAEADWHMLFERKVVGRRKYEEIYEFFLANSDFAQYAPEVLYPELPVVLPTFLPAPNSREKLGIGADEDVSFFGYFDVRFSIDRAGKTRRVKITGQGGEVTKVMEMRLNEYLRKILFRPRYDRQGKLDTNELRLRYYVGV